MNLLIMGAPGAGKGTQAEIIKKHYNLIHLSTGEMFREAIALNLKVGDIAKDYLDRGELVLDKVTIDLVRERLQKEDLSRGILFDGFPRTIVQAEALQEILKEHNTQIDKVINLVVSEDTIIRRITGRRVCEDCGAIYHIEGKKPKVEGICDICGGKLIQRADDTVETVQNRLSVYYEKTKPLLDFYKDLNLLIDVCGEGEYKDTFEEVKKVLEGIK